MTGHVRADLEPFDEGAYYGSMYVTAMRLFEDTLAPPLLVPTVSNDQDVASLRHPLTDGETEFGGDRNSHEVHSGALFKVLALAATRTPCATPL